jgi:threonine dehydratase
VKLAAGDLTGIDLHLKLENLQPIGSFKLRGAANAVAIADRDEIAQGVYTASAGNMAQGVAWCARERGVPCTVVVPELAPRAKTDAIERLGGRIVRAPFERWWQTMIDRHYPGIDGLFVHPFADARVMAGNGTIALELFEDIDDIDAVLIPFGGGGLAVGIAAMIRQASPTTEVYAVEVEGAAPLRAAFDSGEPTSVEYTRSFVDGIGSARVMDDMWTLAQSLLAGTMVVSLVDVAQAVRLLVQRARIVTEGAGASAVAAALSTDGAKRFAGKRVACIVSGGNIDPHRLATILGGGIPE